MNEVYGLIGHPLGHSFSKKYFTNKFSEESIENCDYKLFDLSQIDEVETLLSQEENLKGFNITIPYKQAIFPYLDELDPHAKEIEAVNVVKIEEGKLKGFNSDYIGFLNSLKFYLKDNKDIKALILGTGGASKAIAYALRFSNIPYQYVSRKKSESAISYDQLRNEKSLLQDYQLIVNTTPLGTFPNVDNCPEIPYDQLNENHFLYDLVYNPEETKFLQLGKEKGALIKNGYEMLVGQAEESWRIWQDQ